MPSRRSRVRDAIRHELLPVFVVLSLIALIVACAVSVVALKNSERIKANDREDRERTRMALYRLCSRDNGVRVELQAGPRTTDPPNYELIRNRERRLPTLDCSGNLLGNPPVPLPPRQQRAFYRAYVRTASVPIVCAGEILPAASHCVAVDGQVRAIRRRP